MKTIKCYMAIALLLLFSNSLLAQAGPPAMAMPTDSNTVLIDKIIEVTRHEQYFINYCHDRIIAFVSHHHFQPHFHTHYVFFCVARGINEGSFNKKRYTVTPDDFLIIHPGEIHSGNSSPTVH